MSVNDLLSDMVARIKNGQNARLSNVECPFSGMLSGVLDVLQKEGYIRSWTVVGDKIKNIEIELKYSDGLPAIKSLTRLSKPGKRVYTKISDLNLLCNGLGVTILSTDQGVLSDNDARKINVGGEMLCNVF